MGQVVSESRQKCQLEDPRVLEVGQISSNQFLECREHWITPVQISDMMTSLPRYPVHPQGCEQQMKRNRKIAPRGCFLTAKSCPLLEVALMFLQLVESIQENVAHCSFVPRLSDPLTSDQASVQLLSYRMVNIKTPRRSKVNGRKILSE